MPFVPGPSGISDVYHATTVYANNQLVALWNPPAGSPAIGAPEPVTVTLSLAQTEAIATTGALATSDAEAEAGLSGRGEVPQEGPVTKTTPQAGNQVYATVKGFPAKLDPNANPSAIFTVIAKNLDSALAEAAKGAWKETGSNPNIIACYKAVGFNYGGDSTPWCAGFAGSLMKASGVQALKTLSSLAYRGFGTSIPVGDKSKWRLNDVIIFTRKGGGHIGFFRGYNPANGSLLIAGGNQGDNLKESNFRSSGEMPVVFVGRPWSVPAEYDKPVTYAGRAGSGSVKVV